MNSVPSGGLPKTRSVDGRNVIPASAANLLWSTSMKNLMPLSAMSLQMRAIVSSTGLPGTVRVYVNSDLAAVMEANGLIPWDRAQAPFLGLSKKFGDLVQGMLVQRFKGSPDAAQTAAVRQLRTTAAPAIAVEISSIVVEDRAELDRMGPGVADAIARGAAAFKPSYVVANVPGTLP